MPVFTVFELIGGRIQKLGRIYFEKVPSKGDFISIASVEADGTHRYEVIETEPATDTTCAGDIVVTLES